MGAFVLCFVKYQVGASFGSHPDHSIFHCIGKNPEMVGLESLDKVGKMDRQCRGPSESSWKYILIKNSTWISNFLFQAKVPFWLYLFLKPPFECHGLLPVLPLGSQSLSTC